MNPILTNITVGQRWLQILPPSLRITLSAYSLRYPQARSQESGKRFWILCSSESRHQPWSEYEEARPSETKLWKPARATEVPRWQAHETVEGDESVYKVHFALLGLFIM